ncbi:MAG: Stp1/IreP family PP2C-type Ser/Thr phosphatase [Actinomycetota bacterium]|nr:Stp1/IreP family PP2C-type Ser/Thr phosphatase [Actinomycetota bacterium]
MRIRAGATTDVGRVRQNNEDSHLVSPPLYAVADGMGGGAAGEVASGLAVHTLQEFVQSGNGHPPTLSEWVVAANSAIYERALERPDEAGMGTTITVILAEDDRLRLAHVGDSRAYLLRDGDLTQLTEDHTRVNRMLREGLLTRDEAAVHPQRNVVTRALGIGATVQVDETVVRVRNGDRLLLCSDGLSGMVSDDAIEAILASSEDPQEASRRLVEAANEAGGVDNITALVLDVDEVPETSNETLVDVPPAAGQTLVSDRPGQAVIADGVVQPPPAPPPPVPTEPGGRRRSRRALVAAGAVVIVAATAVAVALALSGGGDGKPAPATPVATSPAAAATEKQAVDTFDQQLQSSLPGSGPIHPSVFPRLPHDLDTLGGTTGKVPQALAARADEYALQSGAAVRGIRRLDVVTIVPAQFGTTRTDLLRVRSDLLNAFQRYQDAAALMQRAVNADKQRTSLVARARSAEQQASAEYTKGYDALVAVWRSVGLPVPTPSPSPSPKPSPKASKTPSPTTAPQPTATKATPKPTGTGGGRCLGSICFTPPPTPSIP